MTGPVLVQSSGPGCLIRGLWFILIGWWLGGLVSAAAWALNATIILLPIGLYIINRMPTIITLAPLEQRWRLEDGVLRQGVEQYNFFLRAIYFLLIGIWFSGVWLAVAYLALVTIIGIPVSFWMYNRIGLVTTLHRS